jgi:hypothetical protein
MGLPEALELLDELSAQLDRLDPPNAPEVFFKRNRFGRNPRLRPRDTG